MLCSKCTQILGIGPRRFINELFLVLVGTMPFLGEFPQGYLLSATTSWTKIGAMTSCILGKNYLHGQRHVESIVDRGLFLGYLADVPPVPSLLKAPGRHTRRPYCSGS